MLKAPLPANSVTTAAINNGAVTPDKRSGGFNVGTISSSTLSTTGNKTITGVGFTPKLVRFTLMPSQSPSNAAIAVGAATATTQYYSAMASSSGGFSRLSSTTSCIAAATPGSGSAAMAASFVSMNSDGFTINVTIASNTFDVAYEAYA